MLEEVNFKDFKSNLERKIGSFYREPGNRLKIASTSSDLPPERRDFILKRI